MDFEKQAIKQLKAQGSRITNSRRQILRILAAASFPLSSLQIFERLQEQSLSVDQASVYRTLDLLSELDLLHRDTETKGYFPCTHCQHCPESTHIFLRCQSCTKVREVDFHGEVFSGSFKQKLRKLKSRPERETIYLQDVCQACS